MVVSPWFKAVVKYRGDGLKDYLDFGFVLPDFAQAEHRVRLS